MNLKPIVIGAAAGLLVLGLGLAPGVKAIQAALVNVSNTAANPVPTRMSDKLNGFGTRVFPSRSSAGTIVVPADRYLVITSVTGFNNGGLATDIGVDARLGGVVYEQRFAFHRPQPNGLWYLEPTAVEMVADPGSTVSFFANTTSSDTAGFNIDVRGHYIPAN